MKHMKLALWLLPLLGTACSLSQLTVPGPDLNAYIGTAAAQTVAAMPTATPQATDAPPPLPTETPPPPPTETPLPTATVYQAPTTAPTATRTPIPCDWAAFVEDISIPDRTQLRAGQEFTKTWRLRNIGGCAWQEGYSLVFADGARMGGPSSVRLEKPVASGKTVDISVRLQAPEKPGDYRGYWRLRTKSGTHFGIGPNADKPIWVDIKVMRPMKMVYRFVAAACDADWETNLGDLPCLGTAGAPEGFVVMLDNPKLDGGRIENEPGLWTQPPSSGEGWIRAEYPAFTVEKGDRFRALLACQAGATGCKVKFLLQYRIGTGAIRTLEEWKEKTNGEFLKIDLDLSSLAGKKVNFILTVDSRGDPAGDEAVWVEPSLWR